MTVEKHEALRWLTPSHELASYCCWTQGVLNSFLDPVPTQACTCTVNAQRHPPNARTYLRSKWSMSFSWHGAMKCVAYDDRMTERAGDGLTIRIRGTWPLPTAVSTLLLASTSEMPHLPCLDGNRIYCFAIVLKTKVALISRGYFMHASCIFGHIFSLCFATMNKRAIIGGDCIQVLQFYWC